MLKSSEFAFDSLYIMQNINRTRSRFSYLNIYLFGFRLIWNAWHVTKPSARTTRHAKFLATQRQKFKWHNAKYALMCSRSPLICHLCGKITQIINNACCENRFYLFRFFFRVLNSKSSSDCVCVWRSIGKRLKVYPFKFYTLQIYIRYEN